MTSRFTNLRCKEVVNVCDGNRLGCVCDLELELPGGGVCALFVPGPPRFWGVFGHDGVYRIPWGCVRSFGGDMILVEIDPNRCLIDAKT